MNEPDIQALTLIIAMLTGLALVLGPLLSPGAASSLKTAYENFC